MSFLDSIKAGMNKAEEAERHIKAVDKFFTDLNIALGKYDKAKVKIERSHSTSALIALTTSVISKNEFDREYKSEDILTLVAISKNMKTTHNICKWRQHIQGLPCTLKFEGQEYICTDIEDLEAAINELLSSVTVGKIFSEMEP